MKKLMLVLPMVLLIVLTIRFSIIQNLDEAYVLIVEDDKIYFASSSGKTFTEKYNPDSGVTTMLGKKLVLINDDLYSIKSNSLYLISEKPFSVDVSLDELKIAYTIKNGYEDYDLFVYDSVKQETYLIAENYRVVNDLTNVCFSPNGKYISYTDDYDKEELTYNSYICEIGAKSNVFRENHVIFGMSNDLNSIYYGYKDYFGSEMYLDYKSSTIELVSNQRFNNIVFNRDCSQMFYLNDQRAFIVDQEGNTYQVSDEYVIALLKNKDRQKYKTNIFSDDWDVKFDKQEMHTSVGVKAYTILGDNLSDIYYLSLSNSSQLLKLNDEYELEILLEENGIDFAVLSDKGDKAFIKSSGILLNLDKKNVIDTPVFTESESYLLYYLDTDFNDFYLSAIDDENKLFYCDLEKFVYVDKNAHFVSRLSKSSELYYSKEGKLYECKKGKTHLVKVDGLVNYLTVEDDVLFVCVENDDEKTIYYSLKAKKLKKL